VPRTQAYDSVGPDLTGKLAVMACGFNLGDYGVAEEAERALRNFPYVGFGELTLQSDDINNMTVKGGNWTHVQPAVSKILGVAASTTVGGKPKAKQPLIFTSDARSISTKPYRGGFEYIDQVESVLQEQPGVKCLWISAGIFERGLWEGYGDVLKALLKKHENLFISITPPIAAGKLKGMTREQALEIVALFPKRACR
jgi:hypothetical protein